MGLRDEIRRMRLQEWGKIIQDRLDSGLTIDKYCKEHSMHIPGRRSRLSGVA